MEPRDAAWNRVSERFASLGETLRRHYQQEEPGEEPEEETREKVEEALRTLGDAADRLATAAGNALRDPDVQREAKDAAVSLVDALGVTFSTLSGRMRERIEGQRGDDVWEQEQTPPNGSEPRRGTRTPPPD
jgi:hypothetical protein